MPTNAEPVYLDSSAVVKLILREPETDELVRFLAGRSRHVSCALVYVEVLHAVRPHGTPLIAEAHTVLLGIRQMRISRALLELAAAIDPTILRTLDAIHLAAARRIGPRVEVVTYDRRLQDAARAIGLRVLAPGS